MLFSDLKHEESDTQKTFLPNLHHGKRAIFLKFWYQIVGFFDLNDLS